MMKNDSAVCLKFRTPRWRAFSALSIALSLASTLAAFAEPVGTSWTYQGQLRRSGAAYTGTCNFQFSLWDAASGGTQQGSTLPINGVSVTNGLFTLPLDFGDQFKGDSRWLATSVQCSGDGGFTQLDPRQPITAAPYAMSLRPGATIQGSLGAPNSLLRVNNSGFGGNAIEGNGFNGVIGRSNPGSGGYGVAGGSDGTSGAGVFGSNDNGKGVQGTGLTGVHGMTSSPTGRGVFGDVNGANAVGVVGNNTSTTGGDAIKGTGFNGVHGVSNGSSGGLGVLGQASGTGSAGVSGSASGPNSAGVFGSNNESAAIWGTSTGVGSAIYGENFGTGYAGRFIGPVHVQGNLSKSTGTFRIDHPLDPANKFLSHSFVESPDMMNIYNGNVVTDARGKATVTLPDYFAALNRDPRYQLTVVGQFAQAIVSQEIAGNSFEIQTDKPGVKVSWLIMGNRQDAYAKAHPIVVEEFKPADEQGKYLYPAGFGAGEEKRIGHLKGPVPALGTQTPADPGPNGQASK
ncbi:hypothetical protein BH20VER1_BH20VER1_20470 [soil metagenome]